MAEQLDLKKPVEIISFYNALAEHERRSLLLFMQGFTPKTLYEVLENNKDTLSHFESLIPALKNLLDSYRNFHNHLKAHPDDGMHFYGMDTFMNGPVSDLYTTIKKPFLQANRDYQKWIKVFSEVVSLQKGVGTEYSPDRDSQLYKIGVEAARSLSMSWFVQKVVLYGSVAKGKDTPESDVDLAIYIPSRLANRRISLQRYIERLIDLSLEELRVKYGQLNGHKEKIISILCPTLSSKRTQKMFEMTGFFDGSATLYDQSSQFDFKFKNGSISMDTDSLLAYVLPTYGDETSYWLFSCDEKIGQEDGDNILLDDPSGGILDDEDNEQSPDALTSIVIGLMDSKLVYAAKVIFPYGFGANSRLFVEIDAIAWNGRRPGGTAFDKLVYGLETNLVWL